MGDKSAIEWTDATWGPIRGCSRVSRGCERCYAERIAARFAGQGQPYEGLTSGPRWTGAVRFVEEALALPLRWKRPRRIFVNSMSDLFHEKVEDAWIDRIFAVMALCPQHTFQCLTKRPERMLRWFETWRKPNGGEEPRWCAVSDAEARDHGRRAGSGWPLPNVWLGVSVEDQATADARIPLLLQTPAAVRWVSYEPALGPVDFTRLTLVHEHGLRPGAWLSALSGYVAGPDDVWDAHLDWIVVGGESGPGARPFDLAWARETIAQCRAAGVPVFVKQLGARPFYKIPEGTAGLALRDRKGGDPAEWPEDLRVRESPRGTGGSA